MDSLRKNIPPQPIEVKKPLISTPVFETFSPSPAPPYARKNMPPKKGSWVSSFLIFLSSILFLAVCAAGFLVYKGFTVGQSMQFENTGNTSFISQLKGLTATLWNENREPLDGERDGRINILLLGRAGEHYPGKNLTDTVMIMSIDTENKKVALLSLPRDLYVPITETNLYTKLNSLYQYGLSNDEGVSPLQKTIEDITGQPIHYFFTVDFDGFESVVDTLGGIQVDVVRDFYDTRYPGKNYSYETFELKKGWQTLDGATALKYVRERHDDPEGDFGRAKRQQQVIQAVKDKATSTGIFLNIFTISRLLDTLGENVKTDMSLQEMESFIELSKTLDTKNVTSVVIDAWKKESLLRVSHVQFGEARAFILVPRVGNWSEIKEIGQNIFSLDRLKERRAQIRREQPTLTLLYSQEDTFVLGKVQDLAKEMGFEEIQTAPLVTLEDRGEKSIIVDRAALSKPFSLDELLQKFSLEKVSSLPTSVPKLEDSDFVIVIGSDLVESLSLEDEIQDGGTLDEPVYSEILPPQPKPDKKKKR